MNKSISEALKVFDVKYFALRYDTAKMTSFSMAVKQYIGNAKEAAASNASEENIKNIANAFLKQQFYSDENFAINAEKNIDSTIRYEGKLLALIEVKRPTNKTEMTTVHNLNKKALWEITSQ